MSEEPDQSEFGVRDQGVLDLAARLKPAGSLWEAFPAALVAPVWRALLEADVIETPVHVDPHRVEVLLLGPNQLELRVPYRSRHAEFVKVVPVWVGKWLADGDLANQIDDEARRLAMAIGLAASQHHYEHSPGQGQKPHN